MWGGRRWALDSENSTAFFPCDFCESLGGVVEGPGRAAVHSQTLLVVPDEHFPLSEVSPLLRPTSF